MPRWTAPVLAALAFAFPNAARAEPFTWIYSWDLPSPIPGTNGGVARFTPVGQIQNGSWPPHDGKTSVDASLLEVERGTSVSFANQLYALTMHVTDFQSGRSGQLVFHGVLNGTFDAQGSTLTGIWVGASAQRLILGNHVFDASMDPVSWRGPRPAFGDGGPAYDGDVGGEVNAFSAVTVPEPSALALAMLGLPAAAWARRRARPAT